MAYANYPQNIYDQWRTLMLAAYAQINIVNKRIIDDEGVVKSDEIGKFNRALGLWLISDSFSEEGQPQVDDRVYEFEGQLVVRDTDEDQNQIWDMAERIKFTCESNKQDTTGGWYRAEVASIDYALPNAEEPNLKRATLIMRFQVHVIND